MSETTEAVAASSAAEMPEIPASGTDGYAEWRMTGRLPEPEPEPKQPEKQAESASAKKQNEEPEDSADSAAKPQQERKSKRRPDIEARFHQYTERIDRLERELANAQNPQTKADSSPANAQQAAKPTVNDVDPNGNPRFSTYEEYVEALADWKANERYQLAEQQARIREQSNRLQSQVEDARKRYGDAFDGVLAPTVSRIVNDPSISQTVKAMLNDSETLPDVIYTLGSDAETLRKFLSMPEGKQLRYIAAVEAGIEENRGNSTARNEKGQFSESKKEAPAKRGPESAPEPPIEIGHRGTSSMDESERSLQSMQRGDANAFRAWKQAEDRKALARRRGA